MSVWVLYVKQQGSSGTPIGRYVSIGEHRETLNATTHDAAVVEGLARAIELDQLAPLDTAVIIESTQVDDLVGQVTVARGQRAIAVKRAEFDRLKDELGL